MSPVLRRLYTIVACIMHLACLLKLHPDADIAGVSELAKNEPIEPGPLNLNFGHAGVRRSLAYYPVICVSPPTLRLGVKE